MKGEGITEYLIVVMFEERIKEYIENQKQNMLSDLAELVSVDSSLSEPEDGKPFGVGAAKVFDVSMRQLINCGFKCRNYENYVLTADLNDNEKGLDILAHLDVVPGGDGWTETTPFEMKIDGDMIYGRGTADDKGPAIAAMYAMKAIKDLNIPLKKNVRLILGGCEECGGNELEYYYSKEKEAPATFSPDADFPLVNVERGTSNLYFSFDIPKNEESIVFINSGVKKNVVPGYAEAVISGIIEEFAVNQLTDFAKTMNLDLKISAYNENILIQVNGESCHSSTPENGKNALTGLLELISKLKLKGKTAECLEKLSLLYPYRSYHGEGAGIDLQDEKSGRITSSLNMLNTNGGKINGVVDSRIPLCADKNNYDDVLIDGFKNAGFTVESLDSKRPHYVSKDTELVKALLDSYENITGKREEPLIIGGGTYVHELESGVAFGCGEDGTDNRMHASDEFMKISTMLKSARIFADAIIRICG